MNLDNSHYDIFASDTAYHLANFAAFTLNEKLLMYKDNTPIKPYIFDINYPTKVYLYGT